MASTSSSSSSSTLRNRKQPSLSTLNESVTELPWITREGDPAVEVTKIPQLLQSPTAELTGESPKKQENGSLTSSSSELDDSHGNSSSSRPGPRLAMTGSEVAKDETRFQKFMVRVISGAALIAIFVVCVYLGHLYVCLIVALGQMLLFRELVKVRYHAHFHTIENTIPLFRTTQWMWFSVAIFYTYGDFIAEIIQNNQQLHYLIPYVQYSTSIAFILYSGTFVLTIATMQTGHIKFQLNQLCWTIVVLCLTVGQMKYIMHNIFNGLYWFTLPFLLVVTNDIMAYASGVTCGRKFIHRPFISFSPNKTWEGFIGGGIFTIVISWYLSRFLAQYTWMTCPTNEFRLFPGPLECDLDPIFQQAQSIFPHQIFELLPHSLVKMIPGIVEICSVKETAAAASTASSLDHFFHHDVNLTRCISGEPTHAPHHFELVLKNVYPVQIHALWLALFASLVAPFGGFLASAIKRAYGIKDFDSLIPGHGGVMDRMDCQFLMALCTWVHYNTFVRLATISVPKLMYLYGLLSEAEKKEFLEQLIQTMTNKQGRRRLEDYVFV